MKRTYSQQILKYLIKLIVSTFWFLGATIFAIVYFFTMITNLSLDLFFPFVICSSFSVLFGFFVVTTIIEMIKEKNLEIDYDCRDIVKVDSISLSASGYADVAIDSEGNYYKLNSSFYLHMKDNGLGLYTIGVPKNKNPKKYHLSSDPFTINMHEIYFVEKR